MDISGCGDVLQREFGGKARERIWLVEEERQAVGLDEELKDLAMVRQNRRASRQDSLYRGMRMLNARMNLCVTIKDGPRLAEALGHAGPASLTPEFDTHHIAGRARQPSDPALGPID